jgi:hypothetical protein
LPGLLLMVMVPFNFFSNPLTIASPRPVPSYSLLSLTVLLFKVFENIFLLIFFYANSGVLHRYNKVYLVFFQFFLHVPKYGYARIRVNFMALLTRLKRFGKTKFIHKNKIRDGGIGFIFMERPFFFHFLLKNQFNIVYHLLVIHRVNVNIYFS